MTKKLHKTQRRLELENTDKYYALEVETAFDSGKPFETRYKIFVDGTDRPTYAHVDVFWGDEGDPQDTPIIACTMNRATDTDLAQAVGETLIIAANYVERELL